MIKYGRTFSAIQQLRAGDVRLSSRFRGFSQEALERAIYEGHAQIERGYLVPLIGGGSRQFWTETLTWATSDGTAIASTASETILFHDVTIPGGYLADGRGLRIRANGEYASHATGTLTQVYSLRYGGVAGTLLCKTAAITVPASMTHSYWDLEVMLQTRVNGATGTLIANGICTVFSATAPTVGSATGAPANASMTNGGAATPAAVGSLDLTTDTALSLTITHGASQSDNSATGHQYTIESLN